MNPKEQQIAIAKACGYKDIGPCSRRTLKPHPEGALLRGTLDPVSTNYGREYQVLPDYLNDLNAMHEAEKTLGEPLCYAYIDRLPKHYSGRTNFALAHATAAQRAEAFLKTLNLWNKL